MRRLLFATHIKTDMETVWRWMRELILHAQQLSLVTHKMMYRDCWDHLRRRDQLSVFVYALVFVLLCVIWLRLLCVNYTKLQNPSIHRLGIWTFCECARFLCEHLRMFAQVCSSLVWNWLYYCDYYVFVHPIEYVVIYLYIFNFRIFSRRNQNSIQFKKACKRV